MTIKTITRAYERTYTDTGYRTAYVEWLDARGNPGRTEGAPNNLHMLALFAHARREGVTPTTERW